MKIQVQVFTAESLRFSELQFFHEGSLTLTENMEGNATYADGHAWLEYTVKVGMWYHTRKLIR